MNGFGQTLASLNDNQISDALTYIRNEWGNSASAVSAEEVVVRDEQGSPDHSNVDGCRIGKELHFRLNY